MVHKPLYLHGKVNNLFSNTGKTGWAAPRLKDADLSNDKLRESYLEVISDALFFLS